VSKTTPLDPHGELDDCCGKGGNVPAVLRHKEGDGDGVDDGLDGLEWEYGTNATDTIYCCNIFFRPWFARDG
jgi:hypothetical protein